MKSSKNSPKVEWGAALGADHAIPVANASFATPIDLLALREEVVARIRSTGGRPTDQTWTLERQVPFRAEVWKALQEMSEQMRETGASASPAQLAALFIEQGVRALGSPRRRRRTRESHGTGGTRTSR